MRKIYSPDFLNLAISNDNAVNVTVVGAGGTGSAVMSKLFQMNYLIKKLGGAGLSVTLFDDDHVSESNVGRQNYYPFDIGENKATTTIDRFNNFGNLKWKAVPERFTAEDVKPKQILITCVDIAKTRIKLGEEISKNTNIIWIDAGNGTSNGQVVLGTNSDAKDGTLKQVIPSVYDLFKNELSQIIEEPSDSCSHEEAIQKQDFGINDAMAFHATQLLWKLIRKGYLEHHGAFIDLNTGSVKPIEVNEDMWALFGYDQNEK